MVSYCVLCQKHFKSNIEKVLRTFSVFSFNTSNTVICVKDVKIPNNSIKKNFSIHKIRTDVSMRFFHMFLSNKSIKIKRKRF